MFPAFQAQLFSYSGFETLAAETWNRLPPDLYDVLLLGEDSVSLVEVCTVSDSLRQRQVLFSWQKGSIGPCISWSSAWVDPHFETNPLSSCYTRM